MMTIADIERLAREEGLERADAIAALARPGYRLIPSNRPTALESSKLGGRPDLPPDVTWPLYDWAGQLLPMLFVGQIALDELVGGDWFAETGGLLSFFYGAHPTHGMTDNFRAVKVLHTPRGVDLERASVVNPLGDQPTLNELTVEPRPVRTLPDDDLPVMVRLGFDWEAVRDDRSGRHAIHERCKAYGRLRDRIAQAQHSAGGDYAHMREHLFLGCPTSEQASALIDFAGSEAELEEWLNRPGMDLDTHEDLVCERALDWQRLLQVSHDDRLRTDFGDSGGLYIGMPADDIPAGDFSRVDGMTQSG
jgi:hypothetical protein